MLLEPDRENPSIRYFTMRDLLDADTQSDQLASAAKQIMQSGPVTTILAQQHSDGFWEEPGPGYYPKYTGTVWSLIMLAQLGADPGQAAIRKACEYVLTHMHARRMVTSALVPRQWVLSIACKAIWSQLSSTWDWAMMRAWKVPLIGWCAV
jgi:hypothetical protein